LAGYVGETSRFPNLLSGRLLGARGASGDLAWSCGSGFWGGRCPSLADYVTGTGTPRGAPAAGGG